MDLRILSKKEVIQMAKNGVRKMSSETGENGDPIVIKEQRA